MEIIGDSLLVTCTWCIMIIFFYCIWPILFLRVMRCRCAMARGPDPDLPVHLVSGTDRRWTKTFFFDCGWNWSSQRKPQNTGTTWKVSYRMAVPITGKWTKNLLATVLTITPACRFSLLQIAATQKVQSKADFFQGFENILPVFWINGKRKKLSCLRMNRLESLLVIRPIPFSVS